MEGFDINGFNVEDNADFGEVENPSAFGIGKSVDCTASVIWEANGLVHRDVYAEVPQEWEYSLTELGQSLKPDTFTLWERGEDYKTNSVTGSWEIFIVTLGIIICSNS